MKIDEHENDCPEYHDSDVGLEAYAFIAFCLLVLVVIVLGDMP